MIKYIGIAIVFFLGTTLLFPQQTNVQKELLKRAIENYELLSTDPEKAFLEAKEIEKEAQKINAKQAELRAMEIQCEYYKTKNDFKTLMITANSLFQRSKNYKMFAYQAIGKRYLFEAYAFSKLYDKAYEELNQGIKIINQLNEQDPLSIAARAGIFISYANYYMLKDDYENQLKYTKLSGKEYEKLPENDYKQKLLYKHYSNLASAYNNTNQADSAKFYATLSQSKDKEYEQSYIKKANLTNLGRVAMEKADYKEALSYFKKAEKLEGYENYLNTEILYDDIIECYQKLQQKDSVKLYEAKKDSLKLNISENQNKSLHNLLNKKETNKYEKYMYALVFFVILMMVLSFFILRKNRILSRQEKVSKGYLETFSENQNRKDYSELLKMLEEGNPAFMNYFNEAFPDFSKKLLEINPHIIQSEIEFCALLKLKIPTKDIAQYKYITPKTVQNKKYLIRKKLGLPKEVDIYQWFDVL